MSEHAPTTTHNPEQELKTHDPAAAFVDVLRDLRAATYENPNTHTFNDDGEITDNWDDLGPKGIDGAYETRALIDMVRKTGEPDRQLRPYEQKTIDFFQTEIDLNRAQSHVNLAELDAPIDGVDNPRIERIQQIIGELTKDQAQIDPANTAAREENEAKIKSLSNYAELLKTSETGHEVRDFINSNMLVETTTDAKMRDIFRDQARKADEQINQLAIRNLDSIEAYAILAQYYPDDPLDANDLPDDPRLDYAPSIPEIPADDTPTVPIDTAPLAPQSVATAPDVSQSAAEAEARASRQLDLEIREAELAELRQIKAETSRGFGTQPEIDIEYRKRVAAAGELWLQGELQRRGISNPTRDQENFLAAQYAMMELGNLTAAKQAADEKTMGTKLVNMISDHPIMASVAAGSLLFASGIGVPAVLMGTAGMVIYAKVRKKTRGIRNANQFVVARDLRDDIALGTINPETNIYHRERLFDAALNHTSDAFAGELRREQAKAVGIPGELERFVSRYARRLGDKALNGAGVTNPARQSAYALAA